MATILIVEDESRFRELCAQTLRRAGLEIRTAASAEEALPPLLGGKPPDLVLCDVRMPGEDGLSLLRRTRRVLPDLPFVLLTAYPDIRDAVAALKLGAVDYLSKPVDLDELVVCVQEALGLQASPAQGVAASPEILSAAARAGIVVASTASEALLHDAARVAQSDATVLLCGESGTGKELYARFVHAASERRRGPFVAVNCGAIPRELLASELFGHEKGAFSGAASARSGHVRQAAGGTLFLDEIGELPLELQPALLRVIETGRVQPVGSDRVVSVDYRLVAATNRDLDEAVRAGRFRADLYYRLDVVGFTLPPLRQRRGEIGVLAQHFLTEGSRAASTGKKRLSRAALAALEAYDWPGNVRELRNALERARLLSRSDVILPEHLPPALQAASRDREAGAAEPGGEAPAPAAGPISTLEAAEREAIVKALETTRGNRTRAAELLGITRRGLLYKLKRFGL